MKPRYAGWLLAATLTVGCSFSDAAIGGPGEFGATPGGVKDLNSARELIKNGQVPPPEAFSVEALFSEHDLPLSGAPCTETLCLRGALGVAPTPEGSAAGWVQVGMSSNIDPERFQRAPQALVLTVDVSGSMGWEYRGTERAYPSPGRLAYLLLKEITARLGPQDRVALVTYGSEVNTVLADAAGGDAAIQGAIESLRTAGSTNMEAGLRRAYEVARALRGRGLAPRVLLFSDEQPNVGATSATEFSQIVGQGAEDGIGATLFGLGLGLRQELMVALSKLRGGNAFSLLSEKDVPSLMADSWPWMVSPIAYSLSMKLTPAAGFAIGATYGFPGEDPRAAALEVSTVFLSRRRGALLLRLDPPQGALSGLGLQGTLSYEPPEGGALQRELRLAYGDQPLDARGSYFEQPSVGKAVALALVMAATREAAERYRSDQVGAEALLAKALVRFRADAAALSDSALDPVLGMLDELHALMKRGAPQGTLYGR